MIVSHAPLDLAATQLDAALRPLGASGPDLGRYFLVCAVLVLLTGGLLLAFRKGLAATVRARAARRSLSILDVLPLGGRQKILVVRCYDRTFLVGAGDKELAPIAELDPAIGLEASRSKQPVAADREVFARTLEKIRQSLPAPRLGAQVGAEASPRAARASAHAEPTARIVPKAPPAAALPPRQHSPGADPARERVPAGPARPRLEGVVG